MHMNDQPKQWQCSQTTWKKKLKMIPLKNFGSKLQKLQIKWRQNEKFVAPQSKPQKTMTKKDPPLPTSKTNVMSKMQEQ